MTDLYCMYASCIYIIPHRLDRPNRLYRPNRLDRRGDRGNQGGMVVITSYRLNRLNRLVRRGD